LNYWQRKAYFFRKKSSTSLGEESKKKGGLEMGKGHDKIVEMGLGRRDFFKLAGTGILGAGVTLSLPMRKAIAAAAPKEPFKLAIVAFTTGPATSYGLPGHEILDILVPLWNSKGGILGRKVELFKFDEGAVANVVETFKRLTKQDKVDAILGCSSSASALAGAPIAEEAKTIFVNCLARTHKVTWQNPDDPTKFRKYVFKSVNDTFTHAASAAIAVAKFFPRAKVAHIHPDYAYGHEIRDIFNKALKKLDPKAEVVAELWPKLFTPDYSPHITKILGAKPTVVFNSFWGSDSNRFSDQCIQKGLLSQAKLLGDHGEFYSVEKRPLPKELIGHPPFPVEGLPGFPDPKRWPLNKYAFDLYYNKHKNTPPAAASFTNAAFDCLVAAIEKAAALIGGWPNNDQIAAAFRGLAVATPLGWNCFREDGRAVSPKWAGLYKLQPPYSYGIDNILHMPIEEITTPPGMDPLKWIDTW
jgi:branched-chain amino acid transport system substrate-binding protein